MRAISRLQFITTNAETAEQACKGGVDWIQLRLKDVSYDEYKSVALEVQAVCKKYNATFIINDNVKLALDIRSDGVHVGKEDPLSMDDIQELLARNAITGASTNTVKDILHFKGKPVSYLGVGPFRFTTTKQKLSPVLGIEGYRKIFDELKHSDMYPVPPLIAIGGITIDDVSVLMTTGLHGIAVSGAISGAPDIGEAARKFNDVLDPSNKIVRKTVVINAPVPKVWKTITDPMLISQWLFDTPVEVISDWKEGSSMVFKGRFHNKPYEDKGTILKYEPETELSYTYWSSLSTLPDEPNNYTVVGFSLKAIGTQTELNFTQSNFVLDTMYRHFNFYWTLTIDRLKKIIEKV